MSSSCRYLNTSWKSLHCVWEGGRNHLFICFCFWKEKGCWERLPKWTFECRLLLLSLRVQYLYNGFQFTKMIKNPLLNRGSRLRAVKWMPQVTTVGGSWDWAGSPYSTTLRPLLLPVAIPTIQATIPSQSADSQDVAYVCSTARKWKCPQRLMWTKCPCTVNRIGLLCVISTPHSRDFMIRIWTAKGRAPSHSHIWCVRCLPLRRAPSLAVWINIPWKLAHCLMYTFNDVNSEPWDTGIRPSTPPV